MCLAAAVLLTACALPAHKVAEVDSYVARHQAAAEDCDESAPERCAVPSPLLERGQANVRAGRHHAGRPFRFVLNGASPFPPYPSDVVGSMTFLTSVTLLAGKPPLVMVTFLIASALKTEKKPSRWETL